MANKFRARPTTVDGIRFASAAEARRYGELKLMQEAGEIRDLECHPGYRIVVNEQHVCTYYADFLYWTRDGKRVVEDVKGGQATRTPVYRLKAKLVFALYGIDIVEVVA